MTVIAVIFYRDGALVVSDSRGTMAVRDRSSPRGVRIRYDDDQVKSMVSRDGEVVVAGVGDSNGAAAMMWTLVDSEGLLKNGDEEGMAELRTRLKDAASISDEAGAVAVFRDSDGMVRALYADYRSPMLYMPPVVRINEINRNIADGVDNTVDGYLGALTREYCPDRLKTTLADAVALAFMLEDRYMHYSVEVEHGLRGVMVGGPMRINVVSNDSNHGYATLIDTAERDSLEGKPFSELSKYFEERLSGGVGRLLRVDASGRTSHMGDREPQRQVSRTVGA